MTGQDVAGTFAMQCNHCGRTVTSGGSEGFIHMTPINTLAAHMAYADYVCIQCKGLYTLDEAALPGSSALLKGGTG